MPPKQVTARQVTERKVTTKTVMARKMTIVVGKRGVGRKGGDHGGKGAPLWPNLVPCGSKAAKVWHPLRPCRVFGRSFRYAVFWQCLFCLLSPILGLF